MDWKNDEDRLVANTEYGDYVIRMTKRPPHTTFEVTLHSNGNAELHGEHDTIAGAVGVAQTDLRNRETMWETL